MSCTTQESEFDLQSVQTGSGARPASNPKGTGTLSPNIKRPESEDDYLSPSKTVFKSEWSCTSISPCGFVACRETILRLFCLARITEYLNREAFCFEQIMHSLLIEKYDIETKTSHDGLLSRRDQRA